MTENKAPTVAEQPVSTLPKHIPVIYIIHSIMNAFSVTMPLSYLTFFITEFTGVSPNLMATVFTVARFADLGVSLVSGAIIQKQKRVRPWILAIPAISGAGAIACFLNPPISIPAKLVLLTIGYCFIHFPMNFMTVSTNTLMMKIAGPNPANRMAITTAQLRGGSVSRIAISAMTMPMVLFFMNMGYNGYFIVNLIYVAITVTGNYILITAGKPYEPKEAPVAAAAVAAPKPPSMIKMYASASKNKAIMILLISGIVSGIGAQVFGAGVMYYWAYSAKNLMMQALAGTIAGFVGLGTAVICPPIARKIGKKNSLLFQYIWSSVCYVLMIFFADGRPYVYIALTCVMSIGTSISMSWGIQLWLDAAEIELYETGVDNRPFLMSLNNIPIKLGFIASGPFVAIMLNSSGYFAVDGVGQMADTARFMFSWLSIPIIGLVLAFLLFLLGYRIKEDYAREAAAANAKAAAEKAAAVQ